MYLIFFENSFKMLIGEMKMAEMNDVHGSIYQNLIDAGCDLQTTRQCMSFLEEGRISEILLILSRHKSALINSVHTGQKQIDCLDFLTYKLKKL